MEHFCSHRGFTPLEIRSKGAAGAKRTLFLTGFTTTSETQHESQLSCLSSAGEVKARRAFTLVEMMVVVAIIGTVTVIALTSQSAFNKTLILANTAYDIALTIRSAESFGISSRGLGSTANAGYGVHFQRGAPDSFILFADTSPVTDQSCTRPDCKPGDHLYSSADTLVQTYTLGNGITVSDFCTYSDRPRCASTGELSSLDIVFARPNPDAFIQANGSLFTSYTGACLVVSSGQGTSRFVSVAASGQIIAEAPSCP